MQSKIHNYKFKDGELLLEFHTLSLVRETRVPIYIYIYIEYLYIYRVYIYIEYIEYIYISSIYISSTYIYIKYIYISSTYIYIYEKKEYIYLADLMKTGSFPRILICL